MQLELLCPKATASVRWLLCSWAKDVWMKYDVGELYANRFSAKICVTWILCYNYRIGVEWKENNLITKCLTINTTDVDVLDMQWVNATDYFLT